MRENDMRRDDHVRRDDERMRRDDMDRRDHDMRHRYKQAPQKPDSQRKVKVVLLK